MFSFFIISGKSVNNYLLLIFIMNAVYFNFMVFTYKLKIQLSKVISKFFIIYEQNV